MLKRYVDDLNVVVMGVKPGTRYNADEVMLEVIEDQIANDEGLFSVCFLEGLVGAFGSHWVDFGPMKVCKSLDRTT